MATNENNPASGAVWCFVGATFVLALPMLLFPDLPWWARSATIAFGAALVFAGIRRLRRETPDKDHRRE